AGGGGAAHPVLGASLDTARARLASSRPRGRACGAAAPRPAAFVLGARALRTVLVPLLRGARRRPARAARRHRAVVRRAERGPGRRRRAPPARADRPARA